MQETMTSKVSRVCGFAVLMSCVIAAAACGDRTSRDDPWLERDGSHVRVGILSAAEEVSVSTVIVDDVVGRRPTLMIEVMEDDGKLVARCAHAMISGMRSHWVRPGEKFEVAFELQAVRDRYCVEHGYLNAAVGEASDDGNVRVLRRSRRMAF